MDEIQLLKYLRGELTEAQEGEVLKWVSESKDNEEKFIELTNLEAFTSSSDMKASYREYDQMMKFIRGNEKRNSRMSSRNKWLLRLSSAAAVILLVFNVYLMNTYDSLEKSAKVTLIPTNDYKGYKELYTNKGVKAMVVLPDSSEVWLNSDTKLIYPDGFDSLSRDVRIEGEGYFKVKSDSLRPMFVTTDKGFSIKVTGTEFNVKANRNDDKAQVTLYKGEINILRPKDNGTWNSVRINPNQTYTIDLRDNTATITVPEEPAKMREWRNGKLIFDKTPLSEVAKMIERWHGYNIVLDKEIMDLTVTATFEEESVIQIMELFAIIAPIKYSIKDKSVTISKK